MPQYNTIFEKHIEVLLALLQISVDVLDYDPTTTDYVRFDVHFHAK